MKLSDGKYKLLALGFMVLMVIGTLMWLYVFSIYEVKYITSESVNDRGERLVCIHPVPLNSFGKPAPFRDLKSQYEILSGSERIGEYVEDDYDTKFIVKGDSGAAILVKAISEFSLYDTVLEIK